MKIDAKRLRGFLDCMHDEADERDKRSAHIREIVKAAKEAGFDTKAVRKVFARERMEPEKRQHDDETVESYEAALGAKGRALRAIEGGAKVGEAAEANGVHRATLARARSGNSHVAKQPSNATPHDPATGEVIETTPPGSGEDETTKSCGGVESRHAIDHDAGPHHGRGVTATQFLGAPPCTQQRTAGVAPGPQDLIETPAERGQLPEGMEHPPQGAPPAMASTSPGVAVSVPPAGDAAILRAQIPTSTDPDRLERLARQEDARQGDGTGSVTVVAAGNLDALSPVADDARRSTRAASGEDLNADPLRESGTQARLSGKPACSTTEVSTKSEMGPVGSPEGDRVGEPNPDDGLDIPEFLRRPKVQA